MLPVNLVEVENYLLVFMSTYWQSCWKFSEYRPCCCGQLDYLSVEGSALALPVPLYYISSKLYKGCREIPDNVLLCCCCFWVQWLLVALFNHLKVSQFARHLSISLGITVRIQLNWSFTLFLCRSLWYIYFSLFYFALFYFIDKKALWLMDWWNNFVVVVLYERLPIIVWRNRIKL